MTTEARRTLAAIAAALAVWFCGLVTVTAVAAPDGDLLAIGPRGRVYAAMAASGGLLMGEARSGVIIRGEGAATVRALYRGGAWLVLPASGRGCMALRG